MRSRHPYNPAASSFAYSFGPGPMTPAIKALILANVVVFIATWIFPALVASLGLIPAAVFGGLELWRPVTYMFVHDGIFHILFNMLTLWMFGVELERMWGSRYFVKYYAVCGFGGAATMLLLPFLPGPAFDSMYQALIVGASGAVFGILLAFALYFPHREIVMFFVFPVPAKYAVMIMGGIALLAAMGGGGSRVAHGAHLGGLVAGYLYLKGRRLHLISEIQYRFLKWRINRTRRRFDVYSGGRADDYDRRVH